MLNPHEHNAQCLLGIHDDWKYKDIKEHLEWLIQNPDEIADGYVKEYIRSEHKSTILGWVMYFLNKK
jgi:hypothetical protein